jgi:hypothetical protein
MRIRSSSFCLALLAALAACPSARAEPTPADIESARALYVKGLELRDGNDLAGSLERFRAAHALAPTPITALELGRAQMLANQLLDARETLLTVERLPVRADESQKAAQARVEAAKIADQLRARIPAVRIAFAPPPAIPARHDRRDARPGRSRSRRRRAPADCPQQNVCCYERTATGLVSSCHDDCKGDDGRRTQACKTTAECLDGTCAVRACSADAGLASVETCAPILGLCP